MSEHVSLAECREIARILRDEGLDACADGQEACACCSEEVWSVVVGTVMFTDEDGEWWGVDVRTNATVILGAARHSGAAEVAEAIRRALVVLSVAGPGATRS